MGSEPRSGSPRSLTPKNTPWSKKSSETSIPTADDMFPSNRSFRNRWYCFSWYNKHSLKSNSKDRKSVDDIAGLDSKNPDRRISLVKLIAITFAAVAGGPYGIEDCIGTGGPSLTLMCLLIIPFFWSLPMALMTAELSCMMPENGGHILWIDKAFGSFWSFQNSYWTLLQTVLEGGLYPVMFMDYLSLLLGIELSPGYRFGIGLVVVISMTMINIWGAESVGSASVIFAVIGFCPFFIMIFLGGWSINISPALNENTSLHKNFPLFITILLWNTAGYDSLGACAGEVKNPAVNFPKALIYSLLFTISLDIVIILVGISIFTDFNNWTDGTFVKVAGALGGNYLATFFAFGAAINVVGLLCALLCTGSRIMYGMANVGSLPRVFGSIHPVYNTPYVAMIFIAVLTALTTILPFAELAQAEMWFYSLSTILKFCSLVQLRRKFPDVPRPYRIPLDEVGVMLFVTIPILCCCTLLLFSHGSTHLFGFSGVVFSLFVYIISLKLGGLNKKELINFEAIGSL